jgi:hypothetical protein
MKAKLNTIKADLYKVFVMGNADNLQMARVYVLITVPVLTAMFLLGHF